MTDLSTTRHAHVATLAQWAGSAPWRHSLPHARSTHALLWITRGQGRCILAGQRRGLGVFNAVVIPAQTLFALELSAQSFGLVCDIPPKSGIFMPDDQMILRIRAPRAQAEITKLLETMQRDQSEARPFWDEALNAHAGLVSVWLRRAIISQEDGDQPRETASTRLLSAYTALIEKNYTKNHAMQDYASQLGVTPTHLTRVSKRATDMTAADMLTGRVLHAARDMLETTELPVNQIAARLGFRSAAYFSRFILKHTGQSPVKLRALHPAVQV